MSKFVIVRTFLSTGLKMYLTESRSAGVSFEAPGGTVTGVGVANLKTWSTAKGAQKWLDARPTMVPQYAAVGMPLSVEAAQ